MAGDGELRVGPELGNCTDPLGHPLWRGCHWLCRRVPGLATDTDQLEAENTASQRRGLPPVDSIGSDWTYLLTDKQKGYLRGYTEDWRAKRHEHLELASSCFFRFKPESKQTKDGDFF